MIIAEILKIVGILSGIVLGIIGAVPQIIQWSKPKPHLEIVFAKLNLKPDGNYHLDMLIRNEAPIFRRATDATRVKAEYHVIDANHEQWGEYGNFSFTSKLPINESRRKEHIFHLDCRSGFNPHTLILEISCDEGKKLRHETQFNINV